MNNDFMNNDSMNNDLMNMMSQDVTLIELQYSVKMLLFTFGSERKRKSHAKSEEEIFFNYRKYLGQITIQCQKH